MNKKDGSKSVAKQPTKKQQTAALRKQITHTFEVVPAKSTRSGPPHDDAFESPVQSRTVTVRSRNLSRAAQSNAKPLDFEEHNDFEDQIVDVSGSEETSYGAEKVTWKVEELKVGSLKVAFTKNVDIEFPNNCIDVVNYRIAGKLILGLHKVTSITVLLEVNIITDTTLGFQFRRRLCKDVYSRHCQFFGRCLH